jgi:hypothetical protein
MDYIYIAMALIATLGMAGGVVGYLSLTRSAPTTCLGWLEQYMVLLLVLAIGSAVLLINASQY